MTVRTEEIPANAIKPLIEISGLEKIYLEGSPGEVKALRGVDLSIAQGEFVSIMGASGSGKSTLLNIIGCMDKATRGSVHIDGVDIANVPQHKLNGVRKEKIGFVFQDMFLIGTMNAIDNVLVPLIPFGISKEDRVRAADLLKKAGLEKRMHHKPGEMSGGQKQRVAVCRALINDPLIILADEPTGNLDSKTGSEIMELLRQINREKGTTIIVVTHDPRVSDYATRTIEMTDGLINNDNKVA
ncbi:MAG: ABC transporter ATP-binding protein [Candidatus Hodarchaeales archaeon]